MRDDARRRIETAYTTGLVNGLCIGASVSAFLTAIGIKLLRMYLT